MAEPKIYVCDLDGTLLRSDGTLGDFSREGLNRLLEAGVNLTVASARGSPAFRSKLAGVGLHLPVIELNGAFVSELESGRHLASNVLTEAEACAALEAILETGVDPVVTSWDGDGDRVHFGPRTNESIGWYVEEKRAYDDPRLTPCEDLIAVGRGEQVAQITTFAPVAEAKGLSGRLRDAVGDGADVHSAENVYWPDWVEITVQHCDSQKGAAVPSLLSACGMPEADVVAFGDHLNDLGLFAAATHSVAPANAHPVVLEQADEIIGSNDEDGVVRYLLDRHG
jgi:Cof subfamily protein (haloacid dehalogenase superfamily)